MLGLRSVKAMTGTDGAGSGDTEADVAPSAASGDAPPEPETGMAGMSGTALLIGGNMASSLTIILLNKQLMSFMSMPATTLTFWHYLIQSMVAGAGLGLGLVKYRPIPVLYVFGLAATIAVAVGTSNLSLQYNSVGFTQFMKMLGIPWTALLERAVFAKRLSVRCWISLAVISIGVGWGTIDELRTNVTGVFIALIAFVAAPLANMYAGYYMRKYRLGAFEMGLQSWPVVSFLLLFPAFFSVFDNTGDFSEWASTLFDGGIMPSVVSVLVLLSCMAGLGINATNLLILKRTSALTYQIISVAKTIILVILGAAVFVTEELTAKKAIGLIVGSAGIMWYSQEKKKVAERATTATERELAVVTTAAPPPAAVATAAGGKGE